MALILLEGLDCTGKSTVAKFFQHEHGYEVIHLSAPPKGTTSDQYLQEMVNLISAASTRDIVLDRTHYGELVWPNVYGRKPLLSEEDIDAIREIEESVGVRRIWMNDPNVEAHWKRCVDNKEPLNKAQFVKARSLYSQLAYKYGFESITLQQFIKKFPETEKYNNQESTTTTVTPSDDTTTVQEVNISEPVNPIYAKHIPRKTPEQLKLEKANAINNILLKRILKLKGPIYDELENDIRGFLNDKLRKFFGDSSQELSLTQEEVKFYKTMYKRAIDKGEN